MPPVEYRVKSERTQYCPVTDNEVDGHIVDTRDGAHVIPPDSILTFSEPVQPHQNVTVHITGPAGRYVALPPGAHEGTQVIWSQKPFLWEVVPTIEGGMITYQFIPAEGGDLYIFDEFGIGPILVVKPGHAIVPPESYFTITPA